MHKVKIMSTGEASGAQRALNMNSLTQCKKQIKLDKIVLMFPCHVVIVAIGLEIFPPLPLELSSLHVLSSTLRSWKFRASTHANNKVLMQKLSKFVRSSTNSSNVPRHAAQNYVKPKSWLEWGLSKWNSRLFSLRNINFFRFWFGAV